MLKFRKSMRFQDPPQVQAVPKLPPGRNSDHPEGGLGQHQFHISLLG